ncbi:hypothetical protein BDV19DRAFT_357297 [Aspergillus venezuelensis]
MHHQCRQCLQRRRVQLQPQRENYRPRRPTRPRPEKASGHRLPRRIPRLYYNCVSIFSDFTLNGPANATAIPGICSNVAQLLSNNCRGGTGYTFTWEPTVQSDVENMGRRLAAFGTASGFKLTNHGCITSRGISSRNLGRSCKVISKQRALKIAYAGLAPARLWTFSKTCRMVSFQYNQCLASINQ